MLNKKIVSVLAVTLMLTMGIGVVFIGNDESEAVTSDTPVAELDMTLRDLYQSGTFSYDVAEGTFIYLRYYNDSDTDMVVNGISTTYGTGDTAGLTLMNNGNAMGIIDKVAAGTITMSVTYTSSFDDDLDFTVTLNVLDTSSSQNNPYRDTISLPTNVFVKKTDYYAEVGTTVSIEEADVGITTDRFIPVSVTAGYGLSISGSPAVLSGTITDAGTITVQVEERVTSDQLANTYTISIHVIDSAHADVRMIGGETWTYTPTTNMTSVLSISGTATSWVSLTSGTVSGTAPTNTSVGQTYDLTITASTSDPNQNVTQTVTFTVDPQITLTAPASYTVQFGTDTSNVLASNFQGGGRSIYSITGGTATGFTVNAATGVLGWDNPVAGTIIFTATSPYTYTSGATNTASATMNVTVTGILTASVSGTLYLVTGKTVPNTPAEAVTLNHNDVGSGTYTWAVVGTNTSGVTVASDGTLGGTPGNVGTYAVTVRCTSVVGGTTQTADTTLNIVIVQVLAFTSSPSSGTIR